MTDKKDAPPKGPERRTPESPGEGAKRPYTTLDLTATEVSSANSKPGKGHPKQTAEPATPASVAARETAAPSAQDGSQAAASRIAAAAASLRQGPTRAQVGNAHGARERPYLGPSMAAGGADISGTIGARRYAPHLAAGLLGGLVAVLGSQFFVSRQPPPAAGDTALRGVQEKLAALQKSVAERPVTALPTEATQRLGAIETGLAQLNDINRSLGSLREAQAKLGQETDALKTSVLRGSVDRDAAGRLDKVEEQIATLSAAANADPQTAARIGQTAHITARLGELENATTARIETLRNDLTKEFDARIADVAEASATAKSTSQRIEQEVSGSKSDATRLSQRVEVLRANTDRMEQSLRALQADVGTLSAALERSRSEIEARLASAAKSGDIASAVDPVAAKVAALETSVQGVERAEDTRKANAERIVLSIEVANLKRAMDRGGSYATELAAVRKIAGGRIDLGALERYQHDGVATSADLAREFRSVANAVLDADAEQPDASLVDRLLSGARTIVRVRKVTHAADDTSTEAIVGRIETAVRESRLSDALAEAKKLPAKAAVPAQDWIRKVEARQSVDAALASIDAELKTSLGGAGEKGGRQ